MKDRVCCDSLCQQGRDCPRYPKPREEATPNERTAVGIALGACGLLTLIGVVSILAKFGPELVALGAAIRAWAGFA